METIPPRSGRIVLGLVVPASVSLAFLVDSGLAIGRGWRPLSRLDQGFMGIAALGLVLCGIVLFLRGGRRFLDRRGFHLFALGLSSVLGWGIVEVALALGERVRYEGESRSSFHRHLPGGAVFSPGAGMLNGVEGEARYTINSRGVRGPEFPDRGAARRILCIGGSTTECLMLDDLETWPRLVMERLERASPETGFWVGDVGISGFAMPAHLRFLEGADLVEEVDDVVLLVGVNDFLHALATVYLARNEEPGWRRRSRILPKIRDLWHRIHGTYDYVLEDRSASNYRIRREKRAAGRLVDTLPDLGRAIEEYRDRVARFIEIARERGVRPVFLTQPTLWSADFTSVQEGWLWMGHLGDGSYLTRRWLTEGMRRFNTALVEECREHGVDVIDLTSIDGDFRYFYDGCHFNEEGARRVAEIVSEGLSSGW